MGIDAKDGMIAAVGLVAVYFFAKDKLGDIFGSGSSGVVSSYIERRLREKETVKMVTSTRYTDKGKETYTLAEQLPLPVSFAGKVTVADKYNPYLDRKSTPVDIEALGRVDWSTATLADPVQEAARQRRINTGGSTYVGTVKDSVNGTRSGNVGGSGGKYATVVKIPVSAGKVGNNRVTLNIIKRGNYDYGG